jgi:Protein of unknown function (DUF4079)
MTVGEADLALLGRDRNLWLCKRNPTSISIKSKSPKMRLVLAFILLFARASAFTVVPSRVLSRARLQLASAEATARIRDPTCLQSMRSNDAFNVPASVAEQGFDSLSPSTSSAWETTAHTSSSKLAMGAIAASGSVLLTNPLAALAVNGEYGILEGRYAGMVHPVAFLAFYVFAVLTAYEGYKWRELRTVSKDARDPSLAAIDKAALEVKLTGLKTSSKDSKNKHKAMGAVLLGSGVTLGLEGGLSSYWRVGELYPGDHLFAGLTLCAIWSIGYALAPWMEKGDEIARNIHVAINVIGLLLFTWQVGTGLEIMINVWNQEPGW